MRLKAWQARHYVFSCVRLEKCSSGPSLGACLLKIGNINKYFKHYLNN